MPETMFLYTFLSPTLLTVICVIYRIVPLYDRRTPDAERLHKDRLLIISSQGR
jgi:hypothetical protein